MLFSTTSIVAAVTVLSAAVNGHMILKTPVPFNKASINSSPLDPSGSDFPCKHGAGATYDAAGADNQFPLGSSQDLSFTGSAVHGGGSCQLSVTYDNPPTKSSVWKVILSIEGGCPANTAGNLPADPNGSGASAFKFDVPKDLPSGKAVLAWTWFNKIGNREMYMNCAPITLSGGSKKRATTNAFYQGLPDMFVANIGNGCATKESVDLGFPNPGKTVQKKGSGPTGPPVGSCAASSGPGSPAPAESSSPAGTSPTGDAPSTTAAKPSKTGGVFAPGGTGTAPTGDSSAAPSAAPTGPASAPEVSPPAVSPPMPKTPASTDPAGSGSGSSGSCDASSVGKSMCNGTTQIGMCDQGGKITWIPVAQGTVCKDGYMVFPKLKRSAKFGRAHMRRRHGKAI